MSHFSSFSEDSDRCTTAWAENLLVPTHSQNNEHYLEVSPGARQRKHRVVVVGSHVVDVRSLVQQELNGAEMPRPGGLHERRAAAFRLMLQIGSSSEQHVGHIRMSIFAGVRQGRVSSSRLSVDVGDGLGW